MYTIEGEEATRAYRVLVVTKGIELYIKTGLKPSRMWTPANMLMTASQITGKAYKRGELKKAASDLREMMS